MKKKLIIPLLIFINVFWALPGCKKDTNSSSGNNDKRSIADQIAGVFNGTGKVLPDGIFLGNYKGCVIPTGWESNFSAGTSNVNITKVSDTLITMSISGGPFSLSTYFNIPITHNGNRINFGFGYYDTNSRFLSFSRNTADVIYTPSPSCLQGMPYYSGGSILNDGNYGYYTHGRADFSGTKQ